MKAKYFLFLIMVISFSACLESTYSVEVEEYSEISFDDCPFFGFWADTLWCADTLQLSFSAKDSLLYMASTKFVDANENCMFPCMEFFELRINDFHGIGNYRITMSNSGINRRIKFFIREYDIFRSIHELADEEDFVDLTITEYNEASGLLRGRIMGQLTDQADNQKKQALSGGRFQGYVR